MKKNNFYYVLKNSENDLFVLENDLLGLYYTDNPLQALKFFNTTDLKAHFDFLKFLFGVNLYCCKILLKENKFICQ